METASEPQQQPRKVASEGRGNLTIDIAGAAIFGALSIIISYYTTANLPRMEWGIAFFDPVSIIWIAAFLIFGFRAGVLTCIIGMVGLIPFDPTRIGPIMKFIATIWLVIIPWLYTKMVTKGNPTGQDLKQPRVFIPGMALAVCVRIPVMIILNYLCIVYIWKMPMAFLSLGWIGHVEISGWTALIVTIMLLNVLQSLFDSIIPYVIVFSGKIYDRFHFY